MTVKETAEKMISDFERYLPDGDWDTKKLAKDISTICIWEIINSHKSIRIATEIAARDVAKINFWNEVKKEIEIL